MSRTRLFFVMGPTCAGKSTFLNLCKEIGGNSVALVEVGKALRAKYPPSHFQGQNNPKHVAEEAWSICKHAIWDAHADGRTHVFIDGQPRDIPQTRRCVEQFPSASFSLRFLLIDASLEERERRARATREGDNLELALARLRNDMASYYSVLVELAKYGIYPSVFDSTNPTGLEPVDLFLPLVTICMGKRA